MSQPGAPRAAGRGLRWYQSLQFKLGALFLLLLLVLGIVAWLAGSRLVGGGLDAANYRYEEAVSHRLAAQVELPVTAAEALASALAVQMQTQPSRASLKALMQALAERSAAPSLIASLGVWPEPGTLEPGVARASVYLLRDANGRLQPREDYNDARSIPYVREAWYTPLRYATSRRCFWTLNTRDLLARRELITCSLPLGNGGVFAGVATVSLDTAELARYFAAATADASGYALLLDRDNRLLALSSQAASALGADADSRNIAELAQRNTAFNPLALALNAQSQKFLDAAVHTPQYDARSITALKDASRDMSRAEAESALATIWNADGNAGKAATGADLADQQMRLSGDAVLHSDGYAVLRTLPGTHWRLASVTAAREGADGARYLISQALVVTLGAAALTLALAWGAIRRSVVRPLRRMAQELAAYESNEDALAVSLDDSARNEVGLLAHWYNERVVQLRGEIDGARNARGALAIERSARKQAQDALIHVQERASLALGSVTEAVIATDERGLIDDLNATAERLLGTRLELARGQAFARFFAATLDADGAALPDPSRLALEHGARIEHFDGLTLHGAGRDIPIALLAVPLRATSGQDLGCIIVIRELIRDAGRDTALAARASDRQPLIFAGTAEISPPLARSDEALWLKRLRAGLDDDRFHLTTQWLAPAPRHAAEGEVFEVLLTLEDEEGFWSPASAFLPTAERNGLGIALDRWVLLHTLDELDTQHETYRHLAFCGIKLTGASIADPRWLDFLAEQFGQRPQLAAAGLAEKLCFRLPADALAAQPQAAQIFCAAMRSFGCRVAVAFDPARLAAELEILRGLPLDVLRLDGGTFGDIAGDPLNRLLAQSAMQVAAQLQRRVLVGDLDQSGKVDAWRELGADYLQGYALARPSPVPFAVPAAD